MNSYYLYGTILALLLLFVFLTCRRRSPFKSSYHRIGDKSVKVESAMGKVIHSGDRYMTIKFSEPIYIPREAQVYIKNNAIGIVKGRVPRGDKMMIALDRIIPKNYKGFTVNIVQASLI